MELLDRKATLECLEQLHTKGEHNWDYTFPIDQCQQLIRYYIGTAESTITGEAVFCLVKVTEQKHEIIGTTNGLSIKEASDIWESVLSDVKIINENSMLLKDREEMLKYIY
jgi:hypothetical protein